ncbi:hypothetical protein MnTg02_02611 [bacterium MnTg02]|nr:hypothetical protein MnTg02_02611 [bacterium MnTg02]
MNHTANNLPVHQHRIDNFAAIMHDDVVENLNQAGVGIDLNFSNMTSVRISCPRWREIAVRFEVRLNTVRQYIARHTAGHLCKFGKSDFDTLATSNKHVAICQFEFIGTDVKMGCG